MYINKIRTKIRFALICATVMMLLSVPAWAQAVSPGTSDSSVTMMPVMLGLLGASLVLIIIFVVLSSKKKNGRK